MRGAWGGPGIGDSRDGELSPRERHVDGDEPKGAALIVAIVLIALLTALGLGALALGRLETGSASGGIGAQQASAAADGVLRVVKRWFDAPAGSPNAWMVPAADQVDRSLRRVDPDGDGTSQAFAGATAPWNVIYRQDHNDLFERPYRGDPELAFEGDAAGPDLLLARDSTSARVRSFLLDLASALFPDSPAPNTKLVIARIAIYGAPPIGRGAGRPRAGIAAIDLTVELWQGSDGAGALMASARTSGVLEEIPYAMAGPITAGTIGDGSGLDARWGTIRVASEAFLGADPATCSTGGWPWRNEERRLSADADGDGTADDGDGDGTADLAEWLGLPDATLGDPWFRLIAGGGLAGAPSSAPQPYPFDPAGIPGAVATDLDRSGLFQRIPGAVRAGFTTRLEAFRAALRSGGPGLHRFRYVAGTDPPLYQEEGTGPAISFADATRARTGLFLFDTTDGGPLRDANADGSWDNLTPPLVVEDPAWWSAGTIVALTTLVHLGESQRQGSALAGPPDDPFDDVDEDGSWNGAEPCLQLGYPPDPLAPAAEFTRLAIVTPGVGASCRAGPAYVPTPVTFAGTLMTPGSVLLGPGVRLFGAIDLQGALDAPAVSGARTVQVLFDRRLGAHAWPPPESPLPRTYFKERGGGN